MARKKSKAERIGDLINGLVVYTRISAAHQAQRDFHRALAEQGQCCAHVADWHRQQWLMVEDWASTQRQALTALTGALV